MKRVLFLLLVLGAILPAPEATAQLAKRKSTLPPEPGTMDIEHLITKPITLKILQEAPVYTRATLDRPLGSMAAGTLVKLVALSDNAYRVHGRSRQGEVTGWVPMTYLLSPDPQLVPNLRKLHQRQTDVEALIEAKQVALGMTAEEVQESLGKPNRKSSKLSASGREETLEYVIYERVPQYSTSIDQFGRPFQTVTYIKMETGSMSINLKDNVVETIEETKGNPLGTGGVKIIPGPIIGW
ncbi:hypothetical protein WJU23_14275 [Prosthecobacter sp. SYSU 5D2]|uniref:hypothetical protein n=1 Tax=Prosthecobacter sp. SYSU 5D2 TaxID=3134134 RepID=UPI0031FE491D